MDAFRSVPWRDVPPDGNCFWHAVAAASNTSQYWQQCKNEILGCDVESASAEAFLGLKEGEFEARRLSLLPDAVWGDEVAAYLACHFLEVRLLVWHVAENALWLYNPPVHTTQCVTLKLEHDHFQWAPVPPSGVFWGRFVENPLILPRFSGGAPLPTAGLITLLTHNIGGWRANGSQALAAAVEHPRPVMFLQEAGLSQDGLRAISRQIQPHALKLIAGTATPFRWSSRRFLRLAKGDVPGVATLVHDSVAAYPLATLTPEGAGWQDKGRLQKLVLKGTDVPSRAIIVFNLYAPSGFNAEQDRHNLFQHVAREIALIGPVPAIVVGDFNAHPEATSLAADLIAHGWLVPPWRGTTQSEPTTYRNQSLLDGFLLSPALRGCAYQNISYVGKMQHAQVSLTLSAAHSLPHPCVRPSPRMLPPMPPQISTVDWGALESQINVLLSQAQGRDVSVVQDAVDQAWCMFTSSFADDLRNHGRTEGDKPLWAGGNHTGLDWLPRQTRHPGSEQSKEEHIVFQNLHRLGSLARLHSSAVANRLRKHSALLLKALHLTAKDLDAAIAAPQAHIPDWQDRIRRFQDRNRTQALRRWRTRLLEGSRPSPALFRWLRGSPPQAHFALQSSSTICTGPLQVFELLHATLSALMNDDVRGFVPLHQWLSSHPPPLMSPPPLEAVDSLLAAARRMNAKSAAGLDG